MGLFSLKHKPGGGNDPASRGARHAALQGPELLADGPKPNAALSRAGAPGGFGRRTRGTGSPGGAVSVCPCPCPSVCPCPCPCARPQPPLGTHRLLDDARDDGVGQVQVLRSLRHPGTPCKARTASRGGAGGGGHGSGRAEPTPARPGPGPAPGAGPAPPLTSAPSRRAPRPALPVPSCPAPAVAWRRGGAGGEGREGTEGAVRGREGPGPSFHSVNFTVFSLF